MKIMIVDDPAAIRMIVKKTLRQAGFEGHEISEAEDGAEALAAIQSSSPDLVLNRSGVRSFRMLGLDENNSAKILAESRDEIEAVR